MLIAIAIERRPAGAVRGSAPDLPGCCLDDTDAGQAFARLRLLIEGRLADLLLAGSELPAVRPIAEWQRDVRFQGAAWYEVHINLAHLAAVARHQSGPRRG